jgi:PPE-repeat protein
MGVRVRPGRLRSVDGWGLTVDFGALPPDINSARMYAGPGPQSMAAAAVAWDNLASDLHSSASGYRSVIAGLITGKWLGPSSVAMASAFGPYAVWATGAAARAAEAASHARLAVEIYEAAFVMTVPPAAVAGNRMQLASLIATNIFGQNAPAIAANEAEYVDMWAQDAAAMYQYAGNSAAVCALTPFTVPPSVVDQSGVARQADAAAAAGMSAAQQSVLQNLMAAVPTALQQITTSASTVTWTSIPGLLTDSSTSAQLASILPGYLMAAATPLYGMSSVLGIAQSGQGLSAAAAAAQGAAAAVEGAASGAAGAAASGAGAIGAGLVGSVGSVGSATTLGPLSVPASWTSVIPTAPVSAATPIANATLAHANVPPAVMGSLPRVDPASKPLGPRYGVIPTVMTRPPSGGYT